MYIYLILFIGLHFSIVAIQSFLLLIDESPLSKITLVIFNFILFGIFVFYLFQKRNVLIKKMHSRASDLIEKKQSFLSEFKEKYGNRTNAKEFIKTFSDSFLVYSIVFDMGTSGLIVKGSSSVVKLGIDYLNKQDKKELNFLVSRINQLKDSLRNIDAELYKSIYISSAYVFIANLFLILDVFSFIL